MRRRIQFREGSGTLLFGFFVMMLCLVVALALFQQYTYQLNAENAQMITDAITDGTAVYARSLQISDDDLRYAAVQQRTDQLIELYEKQSSAETIRGVRLDKDIFLSEQKINLMLGFTFSSVTEQMGTYDMYRMAETDFHASLGGGYLWPLPVSNRKITSRFGWRSTLHLPPNSTNYHRAVDIGAERGTNIYCIADGVIEDAGTDDYHVITVYHGTDPTGQRIYSLYEHGDVSPDIYPGKPVYKGEILGTVNGWGPEGAGHFQPHLHFSAFTKSSVIAGRVYQHPLRFFYGMRFDGTEDNYMLCAIPTIDGSEVTELIDSTRYYEEFYNEKEVLRYKTYSMGMFWDAEDWQEPDEETEEN